MVKLLIRNSIIIFLFALFITVATSAFAAPSKSNQKAVAAEGLVKIGGRDVVVRIWVDVTDSKNPIQDAKDALHRVYPEAKDLEHSDFTTTGLVWDQFSDTDPGNNFVTVNYNSNSQPSNLDPVLARGSFIASQSVWNNVASSTFVFADGGNTTRCPSLVKECPGQQYFDGNNDVGWLDIRGGNILGVTWYDTTTDEFDMALDTGHAWSITGGNYDAQTVWTHELGHALGLGHSTVNGSVMEPYYEGIRRVLAQDDIDGITSLYPVSSTSSPSPSSTSSSSPSPTPTAIPTPVPGAIASVHTISYTTDGGKNADKHINISMTVVNESNIPVSGANVAVGIENSTNGQSWSGSATTDGSGNVIFSIKNAPSGTYSTTINNISASGYTWDGATPSNSYTK